MIVKILGIFFSFFNFVGGGVLLFFLVKQLKGKVFLTFFLPPHVIILKNVLLT